MVLTNNILIKLRKPIVVTKEDISELSLNLFQEIKENGQTHGRTDEVLMKNCESGVILEVALASLLGGKLNTQKHDPLNPLSFAYDVEVDGSFIEVKPSNKNDRWFNFNISGANNPNEHQLTRANLTTFLKYNRLVDYIVVGYYENTPSGDYLVKFKWIMNAKNFNEYVRVSSDNGTGTTHYYQSTAAQINGDRLSLF